MCSNITFFRDIKAVRDFKTHFEDISKEYDNVLVRNSQVPRSKPLEVEEVQNILVAIKSCFGHQTLNYVNSIYVLQSKKRHEVLSTVSVPFPLTKKGIKLKLSAFIIHARLYSLLPSRGGFMP